MNIRLEQTKDFREVENLTSRFPSWTFGPISIHPDYKRKGYGLKLLQYALEKAKEMGIGLLQMEGNIEFYKHAGFDLASKMNIHYHAEPREAEVPYFLAQELIPGYWGHREGTYCPPKGYFVADEHPEAFEAYEATFPQLRGIRSHLPTEEESIPRGPTASVLSELRYASHQEGRFWHKCRWQYKLRLLSVLLQRRQIPARLHHGRDD